MNKKKYLMVCIGTIFSVLMVFGVTLLFFSHDTDEESVVAKINDSEQLQIIIPAEIEPTNPKESQIAKEFYSDLIACFYKNNVNRFNDMIRENGMPWITLSGAQRQCATAYRYPSDVAERIYIKKGKLIEVSTEINPPEVETGLSAALFGEDEPGFRESLTKEGFLSNAAWSDADIDYVNQHFDAIYNELAWTIELYQNESGSVGWVIYKLPNNTYIISNGKSWYSDKTSSREFSGKVFVVKKINDEVYDNELKIVAFIDVQ